MDFDIEILKREKEANDRKINALESLNRIKNSYTERLLSARQRYVVETVNAFPNYARELRLTSNNVSKKTFGYNKGWLIYSYDDYIDSDSLSESFYILSTGDLVDHIGISIFQAAAGKYSRRDEYKLDIFLNRFFPLQNIRDITTEEQYKETFENGKALWDSLIKRALVGDPLRIRKGS